MDVELTLRPLSATLRGVTTSPTRVTINSTLSPPAQRWAIAHELAHVLVRRGCAPAMGGGDEEPYADEFAHELLVPAPELERMVEAGRGATDAARVFDVEEGIAILRLMKSGRLAPIARSADGRVHCLRCGVRPTRPACRCVRFRHGLAASDLTQLTA